MEIRRSDWRNEKHVPAIEILEKGDTVRVKVQVGKGVHHPNTFEHHIKWIELYYVPSGEASPVFIGRADFEAHGESGVFAEPVALFEFKAPGGGKLLALSLCNIHGLWEGEADLEL